MKLNFSAVTFSVGPINIASPFKWPFPFRGTYKDHTSSYPRTWWEIMLSLMNQRLWTRQHTGKLAKHRQFDMHINESSLPSYVINCLHLSCMINLERWHYPDPALICTEAASRTTRAAFDHNAVYVKNGAGAYRRSWALSPSCLACAPPCTSRSSSLKVYTWLLCLFCSSQSYRGRAVLF